MTCKQILDNMSKYQDGELEATLSSRFKTHIQDCPHCQAEWEKSEEIQHLITELPTVEVKPHFTAQTMARIRAGREKKSFFRPIPALAYSLVFILCFTLGLLLNQSSANGAFDPQNLNSRSLLMESQDLTLLAIQDNTFDFFETEANDE